MAASVISYGNPTSSWKRSATSCTRHVDCRRLGRVIRTSGVCFVQNISNAGAAAIDINCSDSEKNQKQERNTTQQELVSRRSKTTEEKIYSLLTTYRCGFRLRFQRRYWPDRRGRTTARSFLCKQRDQRIQVCWNQRRHKQGRQWRSR